MSEIEHCPDCDTALIGPHEGDKWCPNCEPTAKGRRDAKEVERLARQLAWAVDALTYIYRANPAYVARICDEEIDQSGHLLGIVRARARHQAGAMSNDFQAQRIQDHIERQRAHAAHEQKTELDRMSQSDHAEASGYIEWSESTPTEKPPVGAIANVDGRVCRYTAQGSWEPIPSLGEDGKTISGPDWMKVAAQAAAEKVMLDQHRAGSEAYIADLQAEVERLKEDLTDAHSLETRFREENERLEQENERLRSAVSQLDRIREYALKHTHTTSGQMDAAWVERVACEAVEAVEETDINKEETDNE